MREQDTCGKPQEPCDGNYIRRTDRELTRRTSHQAELDAQRERVAEVSGISDRVVLEELQELGYTPDTVTLLRLTPVVQVAWADGEITNSERAMILGTAATRNVDWESPAYYQLLDWIAHRPSSEFFEKSRRAIRAALRALSSDEQAERVRDLISSCSSVALASGVTVDIGREGDQERRLIDRLALELLRDDEAPTT